MLQNPCQGCHGLADIENGVRMAPHTALRIASISKSFTSCIIGKMVENGQINLSDKVQKYIDFPVKSETEMTISSLLSHTSGIRHYNKLVNLAVLCDSHNNRWIFENLNNMF